MDISQPARFWALPAAFYANRGLPPGVRQSECDGSASPLDDLSADELWDRCLPIDQELMCMRFVESRIDALAQAILDVEEARATFHTSSARASPSDLPLAGLRLWELWTAFRDRELEHMRRAGDFDDFGSDA